MTIHLIHQFYSLLYMLEAPVHFASLHHLERRVLLHTLSERKGEAGQILELGKWLYH